MTDQVNPPHVPVAPDAKMTPAEAVNRILELRKGHFLPQGVTIRDLINYGRD